MDRDVTWLLAKAKYLVARPGGWVQNTTVGERDPEHGYHSLCLTAAIEVADGMRTPEGYLPATGNQLSAEGRRAMQLLWTCLEIHNPQLFARALDQYQYEVQYFNDSASSIEEVLALLNCALERAVASERS